MSVSETETRAAALQHRPVDEDVDDVSADFGRQSPETLRLGQCQVQSGQFLEFGVDAACEMLDAHDSRRVLLRGQVAKRQRHPR